MIIEINLLENLLLAVIIVSVLLAIGFSIKYAFKKVKSVPPQKEEGRPEYKKIMRQAHSSAKSLLYETTIAAGEILRGTKQTNERLEENLDHVLQTIAENEIHSMKAITGQYEIEYQKHLENIQQQMDQTIKEAIENTQKNYNEKLEKFSTDLLTNALSTEDLVDKKTAELLKLAENEIAEYKKAQLEKISEEVKKLTEKVYKDVLRTTIPQSLHQELILKSLEEAKKDELFKL